MGLTKIVNWNRRHHAVLQGRVDLGVVVVECMQYRHACRCMEWCHLEPLAECSGEGITRQKASAKKYKNVSRLCAKKDA